MVSALTEPTARVADALRGAHGWSSTRTRAPQVGAQQTDSRSPFRFRVARLDAVARLQLRRGVAHHANDPHTAVLPDRDRLGEVDDVPGWPALGAPGWWGAVLSHGDQPTRRGTRAGRGHQPTSGDRSCSARAGAKHHQPAPRSRAPRPRRAFRGHWLACPFQT